MLTFVHPIKMGVKLFLWLLIFNVFIIEILNLNEIIYHQVQTNKDAIIFRIPFSFSVD